MHGKKPSVIAGVILLVGIIALALVVMNFIRLYTAMPSKTDVINFANDVRGEVVETGVDYRGSVVPGDDVEPKTTLPETESTAVAVPTAEADWLSPEQRRILSKLGVDEAKLPKTLTPELEACFNAAIGEVRVEAIKAGDAPTVVEGMKAMTCL
jgi:hypothetical protein